MGEEIEIKLGGRRADLSAAFAAAGSGRGKSSRLVSHYYDTPDDALWRKGYTLRIRQMPRGQELTLKREFADPIRRGEWTTPLDAPLVDIDLLPYDAPKREVSKLASAGLERRFTSEIARRIRLVEAHGASIELALDEGLLLAGDRSAPVCELEFELKSGEPGALLGFVGEIVEGRDVWFETQSKSQRGRALVHGERPVPGRGANPALGPDSTLDQALAAIIASGASHFAANLACVREGPDPEGVHQMRVALRRLRSGLGLFRDNLSPAARALDAAAKGALSQLGPARDLDVFVTQTLPPVLAGLGEDPALQALTQAAQARRSLAQEDAQKLAAGPACARLLLDMLALAHSDKVLAQGGERRLKPAAAKLIERRHAKVLSRGKRFGRLSWPRRHRVRIAVKKLRYACDFFQDLFDAKEAARWNRRLARLQDDMGAANDAHVAQVLAAEIAGGDGAAEQGAALVRGWYGHALVACEGELVAAWREFASARAFWR